jgi:REP element-mobilizing transposase RayT
MPRPKTIGFWQGHLPHWEVEDGKYFVTVHLRGAIPQSGRTRVANIAKRLRLVDREDETQALRLQRLIFKEMEAWLDRAEQSAHLNRPDLAEMVIEAIEHRQQERVWNVFEYVVMPTQLHLFFETGDGHIKRVTELFKRWTGHQAGKLLNLDGNRFWQVEWFDHWSRSDEESQRIIEYIRQNPVKAGLKETYIEWPYGSWSRSREPSGT